MVELNFFSGGLEGSLKSILCTTNLSLLPVLIILAMAAQLRPFKLQLADLLRPE